MDRKASATQRGAIWARQTLDEYPILTD